MRRDHDTLISTGHGKAGTPVREPLPGRARRLTTGRWSRRRLLGLTLAAGATIGASYFAYPHAVAYWNWQQARQAIDAQDLGIARSRLEACVRTWPNSAQTHFVLARICRRSGDSETARKHLEEAERLGHTTADVALEQLLLQAQSGDARAVGDTLVSYLQTGHREEGLIFEALILGYLDVHYLQEVERWGTVWVERYPGQWQARYYRGRGFDLAAQSGRAMEDYQAALGLKPDALEAHAALGALLREKGMLHEALPHLKYCFDRAPGDPANVANLARCHRMLGDAERAQQLLDAWLAERGAKDAAVLSLRGRVERDLTTPERALTWLRQAEKLAPRDGATLSMLVNVLRELGQEEEARAYERKVEDVSQQFNRLNALTKEIARDPDNLEKRYEIGSILLRLGHNRPAVRWLTSVLEIDSRHPPTHLALADHYDSLGDKDLARNHRLAAEGKLKVRVR